MKKYLMLVIKGVIGLLPIGIKRQLKKNGKLTEFYSRSLQRSGLFYGFPSKKKRMVLYTQYLERQYDELGALTIVNTDRLDLDLIILGNSNLEKTILSITEKADISEVHVIGQISDSQCGQYDRVINCYSNLQDAFKSVSANRAVIMINSGDKLHEKASIVLSNALSQNDIVYCDTDLVDVNGSLVEPEFYPDWNPDLHFSSGYINTGVALSGGTVTRIKKDDIANGVKTISQMTARLWIQRYVNSVGHEPYTLVHKPKKRTDLSAFELKCLATEISRSTRAKVITNNDDSINKLIWPSDDSPLVSLIIPTKDAKNLVQACVESILEKTSYKNFEIILIDNDSTDKESLQYFKALEKHKQIRVLRYPGVFNYSAINNFGVREANGEIIGLVNNDIEVIDGDWLTHMVGHALREDIGCVGAKLLYSDGRVQHAGVVLGYGGGAGHAHKYFPRYHQGYLKRLVSTQNYCAVTAACLLVKKSHFESVKGLNEEDLSVAFNDVDFCLRVRKLGVRNLYCAEAELFHHESVSRGLDTSPEKAARFNRELEYLQKSWSDIIKRDPAYNPNLTLRSENFSVKHAREYS
ncbi:glycosyltransferase family 2 protein [Alteromonas sp. KUL49]|uniref:glycosyltransferase family 2 protein n=1 Tax=Alteromonas sp. KUL49 TaxID=2480798 RepID=UPI00102F023B|nr:glycosyltransferase family 2 protein [Alteromonas sp. KUL49]TAP37873.1 glycosyltransferase [Alteromonas sp. KUL49]